MKTPARTSVHLRARLEHALNDGFISRRLVLLVLEVCRRVPQLNPFEHTQNQHFILDTGVVHMFLGKCYALLAIQLAVSSPSKESSTEEPVLCIGKGESAN